MRTVVIWVVLVVLFVAFSKFLAAQPQAQASQTDESFWLPMLSQFIPILVLFLVFVVFLRRAQTKNLLATQGVALMSQGRYAEALEKFEQYRGANPKEAPGAFNLGVAKLCLWKLEGAADDLKAAEQLGGHKVASLVTLLPEHLALTLALLSDQAGARRSLAALPAGKGDAGRVALAEAILLARAGSWSEARRRLGSYESKQLAGSIGALSRAVDAMCVESLTGELRHVDRIALFGETGPQELRKAWPELVAFVERAPAS
ncbi:MAG: hypothetical protein JNM69_16565 [Archangium sp.]|nr:hypothetical protein [Archangium sp.]